MPAQFNPDVVAAAGGHDREAVAARSRTVVEFVLDRAHLAQRSQGVGREQLGEHAFHCAQAQPLTRQLHRPPRSYDIGLLSDVKHEGVTVTADDCGQERIY